MTQKTTILKAQPKVPLRFSYLVVLHLLQAVEDRAPLSYPTLTTNVPVDHFYLLQSKKFRTSIASAGASHGDN